VCDGAGDVYINVSATVPSPNISATSDTVIVHQIAIPTACLDVIIMSPDEHQSDNPDNHGHPMIATGQQFAVSAKIINHGPDAAENVVATIYPSGCYSFKVVALDGELSQGQYVSLAPDETGNRTYDTIAADDFVVATFTLVGGGSNDWGLKDCNVRTADICVNATTDTNTNQTCDATDNVEVSVYPAAFLAATIDSIAPSTGIVLGNQFTVNYTVTNYGVADAWNASVTLSADSKVSLAVGPGGYTQALNTIPGWGFGDVNSVEGSFQLQCTAAGLSTLTLTPTGQDECGWQPVLGYSYYDKHRTSIGDTNFQWVQLASSPIYSWFLVPASETIEQSLTGACPDLTSVDIALNSGWNLISLPLIPTNGNITGSGGLLTGIWSHVASVWAYDTSSGWTSDIHGGPTPSLTQMQAGLGYWINMNSAATFTESGIVNPVPPGLPPTYTVAAGWNLMGFKSTCARAASDYMGSVPWVRIWGYANGAWSAAQSGTLLQPGLGYWIAATSAGTIYP